MKLYYIMDPMCSWCWGFRPVFETLLRLLPAEVEIQHVMGGLAPDSDEPMPQATREYVQSQWHAVEAKTGAKFNREFWEKCQPRRSTYPACRAVIAASLQQPSAKSEMIRAIQRAYYLQARNPSDLDTLVALANEIHLDSEQFASDIKTTGVEQRLQTDFHTRQRLSVSSFPSLRFEQDETIKIITIDYADSEALLKQIVTE